MRVEDLQWRISSREYPVETKSHNTIAHGIVPHTLPHVYSPLLAPGIRVKLRFYSFRYARMQVRVENNTQNRALRIPQWGAVSRLVVRHLCRDVIQSEHRSNRWCLLLAALLRG